MAAAGHRQPGPDLYQVLGVARDASQQEIALAWRRQAREQHPDARPGDADAPGRFRALAGAWQVLGDPGRRAAYDKTLGSAAGARVTVRHMPAGPSVTSHTRAAGPPLVAGPVRVETPGAASPARDEEDLRLTVLAELALRCLARDREWPW